MARHRFHLLLVMLILLLLALPLMRHLGPRARLAVSLLFAGVMVSAVYAVSNRRKHMIVAGLLALASIAVRGVQLLFADEGPAWQVVEIVRLLLSMTCFFVTVVLIVQHVLSSQLVTTDMISAALCAYLLLGVFWAEAYMLVERLEQPVSSFSINVASTATKLSPHQIKDELYMTAVYLSFVTLSTLGYGDITPATDAARMLTVVEAVIGQFYLTVLVARLVGLHIARQKDERS